MSDETTTPRVWAGCLAHYNAGVLAGAWYPAVEAGDVTLERLHRDAGVRQTLDCEEVWCLDHDGLPAGTGEMGLAEAAAWGELYREAEDRWPVVVAWVETGCSVAQGTGDLPALDELEDRYRGTWDSFHEYADAMVDELGLLEGVDETVARHFDYASWARDLAMDHTTAPAPDGRVYVFAN